MSGDHPQKILDGTKTMTRRVIKPQPPVDASMKEHSQVGGYWIPYTADGRLMNSAQGSRKNDCGWYCPYGQVGDGLWVRETWMHRSIPSIAKPQSPDSIYYKATNPEVGEAFIWKPSIHMPRWASRITLEITEIRVERLQEISWRDCQREGAVPEKAPFSVHCEPWRDAFERLWDSLNAKRGFSWESNPWVWVIGFKVVK